MGSRRQRPHGTHLYTVGDKAGEWGRSRHSKPGLIQRPIRPNWLLLCVLVGLILAWLVLVIAVLRVYS